MAEFRDRGGKKVLVLSKEESSGLGINAPATFEMVKARESLWVLVQQETGSPEENSAPKPVPGLPVQKEQESVLKLLAQKPATERVEGVFEQRLTKEETSALKELLEKGTVDKFRLNDQYKKAIYRIVPKGEGTIIRSQKKGKWSEEDALLEQEGYLIISNEEKAKRLSNEYEELIRAKQLRGLKAFDGKFYLILNARYEEGMKKISEYMKSGGNLTLDQISEQTGYSKPMTKVLCEFMKEDGELMERKRELYAYVE